MRNSILYSVLLFLFLLAGTKSYAYSSQLTADGEQLIEKERLPQKPKKAKSKKVKPNYGPDPFYLGWIALGIGASIIIYLSIYRFFIMIPLLFWGLIAFGIILFAVGAYICWTYWFW
jgi:hypothetical protein